MQGFLLLIALLVPLVTAQISVPGKCPSPPVLKTFDITKFTASPWYEHSKYYAKLEKGYDCISWRFSASGSQVGSMTARVEMRNTYWRKQTYMVDTLTPRSDATIADYDYQCTSTPGWHLPLLGTYPYKILAFVDTATGYAVAWSCKNSGDSHIEILWILTKEQNPTTDVRITAIDALGKLTPKIPVYDSYLENTNQAGCTAQEEGTRIAYETPTV